MAVGAGIGVGILSAFSPGWVFIGLLAAAVGLLLFRTAGPEDRRFVAALFLLAFAARALLSLSLDVGSWAVEREWPSQTGHARGWDLNVSDKTRAYLKIGDSDYYSARGIALDEYFRGSREPVVVFRLNQYGWNSYVDLIGFFYVLFGFSPSAVKGINCLLGAGLALLVFFLGRRIFNRRIARWAAAAAALFPSLMIWSASNLKETPFAFLTLLGMLIFMRGAERPGVFKKLLYALLLGVVLLAHVSMRELFYLLLLVSLIAAEILNRSRLKVWLLALALAPAFALLYVVPRLQDIVRNGLAQVFHKHIGYVVTVGATYLLFPDYFYDPGYVWQWAQSGSLNRHILLAILKAPFLFLFEPFPWRFDQIYHLPALLLVVLWYGILALAAAGIFSSLWKGNRKSLFLFFPLLIFSSLMALTNGNAWTLFRIRDLITPFLILYAAAGLDILLRPEAVATSKLAAWISSVRQRSLSSARFQIDRFLNRKRGWTDGFLASPVRRAGAALAAAVLINSLLLLLWKTEWTVWSLGFRLGVFGLALWALAVRLSWKEVRETSSLKLFLVS